MGSKAQKRGARLTRGARRRDDDDEWEDFDAEFEATRAELERSGRTLTRVLFFVFLSIAVLMAAIALLTGVNTAAKLQREQRVLAQVTALTERQNSEGNVFYYPVVAFDVPDGGRYTVQLGEGSWPPAHRVGDLVTVLYEPDRPLDARIESRGGTFALWTWTLVSGILAVGFALAAALAWALRRNE